MSRSKILANIKKNISVKKVELEKFDIDLLSFNDKMEAFKINLELAGGELVDEVRGVLIEAEFGVAENGACFISHNPKDDRKIYSFYEEITIKLKKDAILNNMQEAYNRISFDEFGIFLSGSSKTADIEQSLVIGAHGAKFLGVLFVD